MAGGFVSGWENVTDQVLQVARAMGATAYRHLPDGREVPVDETELLNRDIYNWGYG